MCILLLVKLELVVMEKSGIYNRLLSSSHLYGDVLEEVFQSSLILGKQAKCSNLRFCIWEIGLRLRVFLVIVLSELGR